MANAVSGNNPQAVAAPQIPGPAFIPRGRVHILLPTVAPFNSNQTNEILNINLDKTTVCQKFCNAMYKVAYAVTIAAFLSLAIAAVLAAQAGLGLANLGAMGGSFLSLYASVKMKNILHAHEKRVKQQNEIAKQYIILNDPAKRDALIQRIAHPQIHPQLREDGNRVLLQKGLAQIAYYQEEQRQLELRYVELGLELFRLQNERDPSHTKILQTRIQLLNVDDSFRLSKIHEAFVTLVLANPNIRQNLNQLVTFRHDIQLLENNRVRRWDWMVQQIVGEQFNDVERTAFLTLKNNRTTVVAQTIDNANPIQLAVMLAQALPQ